MVTSTNHVIAGPDLHRARPLAFWRFSQHLSVKYTVDQDQKKSYDFSSGPLAGIASYDGKSGPDKCITFIKRLDVVLRWQLL